MSSILKALKKLEEEKCRTDGGVDIVRGVLRNRPSSYNRRWVLPVSVSAGAIAASLLTYLLIGVLSQHENRPRPALPMQAASGAAVKTDSPAPGFATALAGHNDKASGIQLPQRRPSVAAIKLKSKKSSEVAPEATRGEVPPSAGHEELSAPVPSPRPLPVLKVSGIAWHKDGNDRVAVVNGVAVTEGMTVEGARVEEISKDRVRFSFEKQRVDVAVGAQ